MIYRDDREIAVESQSNETARLASMIVVRVGALMLDRLSAREVERCVRDIEGTLDRIRGAPLPDAIWDDEAAQ
jgi:hypothetical protein